MIDFRYHLVSLVAVFMALAVGIALGAGPLKDPVDAALGNQTEELRKEKEELRVQVRELESRLAFDEELTAISAPSVVTGSLAGRSVLLVSLPGADEEEVGLLRAAAELAGATVSGTVAVQDSYLEPDQAGVLGDLVARLGGAGGGEGSPYEKAAAALAAALVVDQEEAAGQATPSAQALLAALVEIGFLKVDGAPEQRATLVLTVAGPTPDSADAAEAQSAALLPLVAALDDAGSGEVLGGPVGSAGEGSLIAGVRDTPDLRAAVSTDDVADTASGRTVAVLALVDQSRDVTGHFGIGPGGESPAALAGAIRTPASAP